MTIPLEVIAAMSNARGCVEPDRCVYAYSGKMRDQKNIGTCSDCIEATQASIDAAEKLGWHLVRREP